MKILAPIALAAGLLAATAAVADIKVGVTVSATGPAASLGIPEKNTIALMPKTIGGQKVNYIVLDDASDTTAAVTNTRKLITENKVDVILGSTITPNSLAMIDVVSEAKVPMISMAASARHAQRSPNISSARIKLLASCRSERSTILRRISACPHRSRKRQP